MDQEDFRINQGLSVPSRSLKTRKGNFYSQYTLKKKLYFFMEMEYQKSFTTKFIFDWKYFFILCFYYNSALPFVFVISVLLGGKKSFFLVDNNLCSVCLVIFPVDSIPEALKDSRMTKPRGCWSSKYLQP